MTLLAVTAERLADGSTTVRIDRDSACGVDCRVIETPDCTLVAWGEPHDLPSGAATTARSSASWIRVDRRGGRIDAAVDRFGAFPVLLHRSAGRTVLATHTLAMARALGAEAVPDPRALEELTGVGQLLGDRSTLQGVRHLPAASSLRIEDGVETLAAPPLVLGTDGPARPSQALEAFVAAVDGRLRAAPAALLPLSGGLDSRLILAAALATGHRPEGLVYGAVDSADVVIARELAAAAGVRLHEGRLDAASLAEAAPRIAVLGGGAVALQHGHGLAVPDLVRQTRGRALLTGTGAETWRAFYWDRGLPGVGLLGSAGLRRHMRPLAARWARETWLRSLPHLAAADPAAADRVRGAVLAMIDEALAHAPDAAHGLDALYLGQRVRRFVVAGQQLLDADYARLHPYLDPDVVATWSGLRPGCRLAGTFQRWAIARLAPGLADCRWDRTMRPLGQGLRWPERWPGLADRLGRRGVWEKRGRPLANYGAFLEADRKPAPPPARHPVSAPVGPGARPELRGLLDAWTQWGTAVGSAATV